MANGVPSPRLLCLALLTAAVSAFVRPSRTVLRSGWGVPRPGRTPVFSRPTALLSTASPESDIETTREVVGSDAREDEDSVENENVRKTVGSDSDAARDGPSGSEKMETRSVVDETVRPEKADGYTLPWSQIQQWALRDSLPKYTMILTLKNQEGVETTDSYALWRSLENDVTELRGYPVDFLRKMHDDLVVRNATVLQATPKALPFLDSYAFSSSGGVSGTVYGIPGFADGTTIETSRVDSIDLTLPRGYIRTADGFAAYELGRALPTSDTEQNTDVASVGLSAGGKMLKSLGTSAVTVSGEVSEDADQMLARLGATTGILLAGATAINMLSHHLTVNVFWV